MACAAQASSPNGRQARPIVSAAVSMGFGTYEQMPFLMISGRGFLPASVRHTKSSVVDIAPTIMAHLEHPADGMDGIALQRTTA